jgi:hypothetical protein
MSDCLRGSPSSIPQSLVKTSDALKLFFQHGAQITATDVAMRSHVHHAMLRSRDATHAQVLMQPDSGFIDLLAEDEHGSNAYEIYNREYYNADDKRTPQAKGKVALLRYVECLQAGCIPIC